MKLWSRFRNIFLFHVYGKIKHELPPFVSLSLKKTLPVSIILSLLEIVSLSALFPVINFIINEDQIHQNRFLEEMYRYLNFSSNNYFILFLLSIVILLFLIKNISVYYFSKFQINMFYSVTEKLILKRYQFYMNSPYLKHIEHNSSELIRNVSQIPYEFTTGLLIPFNGVINELIVIFLLSVSIIIYNPQLFFSLILVLFPLVYFYNKFHRTRLKDISVKRDIESLSLYKQTSQSFEGIREFIIFDKKDFFYKSIERSVKNFTRINSRAFLISYISPKIIETVAVFAVFMVFLIGLLQNQSMEMIASLLVLYAIALYRLIPSINKILLSVNNIRIADYTFQYLRFDTLYDTISIPNDLIYFKNTLEIKNLSFKYPNHETHTLKQISFLVKKGSTIGIIGPSGSGKTTLLNILLRLIPEDSGEILVDGKKLTQNNLKSWYRIVGFVPQNITILDGNIIENIAFGINKDEVNYDFLATVIEKAQLKDFISQLPNGFETNIGERGAKISGGQKQRIGIARALYHRAEILIFDEATSALDYETEELLTESINSISHKDITIIIVAHRFQTLKYCDQIYKIENGSVVERFDGYENLLSKKNNVL
jgi:ABC-type multidrug transport system fused ATPase/permease subunit